MTVRSDVLVHSSAAYGAGVLTTVATVPAGERWLIRDFCIYSATAAATPTINLVHTSGAVNARIANKTLAALEAWVLDGRFVVLDEGDVLRLNASVAVTVSVGAWGARFELP